MTKEAKLLFRAANNIGPITQDNRRSCLEIAKNISIMLGESTIGVCAMAEAVHYCSFSADVYKYLRAAYLRTALLDNDELHTLDIIEEKHRSRILVKGVFLGNDYLGAYHAKRMAEVFAKWQRLPYTKGR